MANASKKSARSYSPLSARVRGERGAKCSPAINCSLQPNGDLAYALPLTVHRSKGREPTRWGANRPTGICREGSHAQSGAGGVAAALIVGLGADRRGSGGAGRRRQIHARQERLVGRLVRRKPATKAKAKPKFEKIVPIEDKPALPSHVESAAVEQKRQMNAYLRRVEVCLRLRQIAEQTGNDRPAAPGRRDGCAGLGDLPSTDGPAARIRRVAGRRDNRAKEAGQKAEHAEVRVNERQYDEPAAAAMPTRSPEPLGGDFEQRERSLMSGTFMGRDKP